MTRNRLITAITVSAVVIALAGCSAVVRSDHHPATPTTTVVTSPAPNPVEAQNPDAEAEAQFARRIGNSLLALRQVDQGGWKFQSEIQAPHYQTDRDVGAASVGMGFLALADRFPNDQRWLQGAEHTANWLQTVANRDSSGNVWWPDYVDGSDRDSSVFTSFDDGPLGIGDFFWRLYQKTGNEQYKTTALGTVKWTLAQAENVGTADQPTYRWLWDLSSRHNSQDSDNPPVYNMGMGMGAVGIVNTLTTYYERTSKSDPVFAAQCKQYIEGGLRYIDQVRTNLGNNGGDGRALPETGVKGWDGDTAMNAGYLSGAAGAAYMYLNLYHVLGDSSYLDHANKILSWLQDTNDGPMVRFADDSVAWHITVDPQDDSPDNAQYATGFEEGSAGIGWTFLQAYKVTGNQQYLEVAKSAAAWLLRPDVVIKDGQGGYSWRQDEHPASQYIRPNLDNGAAGISMFLYDLHVATSHDTQYLGAANAGLKWLTNTANHSGGITYWSDNDEGQKFSKDPSWHWGLSGDGEAFTRISGGTMDIPGEQDALAAAAQPSH